MTVRDLTHLLLLYELFDLNDFYSFREMQRIGFTMTDRKVKVGNQSESKMVGHSKRKSILFENGNSIELKDWINNLN